MEENNNITAYNLCSYFKAEPKNRKATLKIELNFGMGLGYDICSIKLDDEDMQHLINKYKISKIKEKEIELSIAVKKLSVLEKELSALKTIS